MGAFAPVGIGFIADMIGLKNSFLMLAEVSLLGGLPIFLVRKSNNQ